MPAPDRPTMTEPVGEPVSSQRNGTTILHDVPSAAAADLPAVVAPPGYELLDEIGSGGMGVVYRARERALNRHVAIKILHDRFRDNGPAAARFAAEAQITGQLQHPGIPPVYEVGAL